MIGIGFLFSNNGMTYRMGSEQSLVSGEVYFDHYPTTEEMTAAFPGYEDAVAAAELATEAQALLDAGLGIISSDASLIGTYPCDPATQQDVSAEVTSILLNSVFTDGTTSLPWPDIGGALHNFDVDHFKNYATAVASFVTGCTRVIKGQSTTLPPSRATIP